jgi:deazaflavin-dependent oxidoreductase (nitroreductase family)
MEYKPEFLYLTTIGWKSGKSHEIEIWYVAHAGNYYLMADHRENAHWVRNLRQQPRIKVYVTGLHFSGTARVVDSVTEPALAEAIAALMQQKYNWSDGLIVELVPDEEG